MFEKQYEALYEDADTLAERIRALGAYAPGSFQEFEKLATVQSYTGPQMSAEKMIAFLLKGYEDLLKTLYEAMKIAQAHGDESTFDVVIGQIDVREKTSWMLRSSLK
jgi:starvation-inducible DNA-binding protein